MIKTERDGSDCNEQTKSQPWWSPKSCTWFQMIAFSSHALGKQAFSRICILVQSP